ncbi:MAG: enoyl-CoA hydratase/isomerase family protein [Chloroflexi bacterium]|nr:enoyl-CoA hydratase/isomerase family protein [Chloroflexota bacterium]
MTSPFETIIYAKEGAIAQIALNRPRVMNAHNIQMRDEMYQALEAVRDDPDVRCLVLRGEGERAFCTGADLTEFGTAPSRVIARQVRWERDLWGLFLSIDKPVIAALHGYVVGSGGEMALLCDLRVAAEDAIFGMPEATLGMIPAAGGTQTLPRTLGVPRALDMLLSNGRLDAARALEIGLVHRVVSKEALLRESFALARQLADSPSHLLKAVKEAMRRGLDMPMGQALGLELHLAAIAMSRR